MTLADQCASAFRAGDMAFYNAAGCLQSEGNTALIESKKSELDLKTWLFLGAGVVAVGTIIFFSTRKGNKK
jgi:hypothetical protein